MPRAAKKTSFLFTDEDAVPPELLAAIGIKTATAAQSPATRPREIGEGDDDDVANPDVPGSTPRHPHPKPEEEGDPTPRPKRDDPDEEEDPDFDEDGDPDNENGDDEDREPYAPDPSEDNRPAAGLHGELLRNVRYEGRIKIVDAWQYNGNLKAAPDYVDRNWVAWGDWDPVREIEPGPALRVPSADGGAVMCRPGDYVVTQEVRLVADSPGDLKVEVWSRDQFEKLFLPV